MPDIHSIYIIYGSRSTQIIINLKIKAKVFEATDRKENLLRALGNNRRGLVKERKSVVAAEDSLIQHSSCL